jgi:hypothetical protein
LSKRRVLEVVRLNHKVCLLACNAQASGDVVKPGQRSKERRLSQIAPSSTLVLA